ncbi:MAG TPA: hypothetical protein VEU08_22100 [Vicinamibacterales bacterium]|nr:hypothetical protein [Vicinamibacterales bacterium]
MCCGTKRLVLIQCPADCVYLASAREHPAAVVVRQQHRDVAFVSHALRDLSERQSEMFFLVATALIKQDPQPHQPLQALLDEDVADAMAALAGTLETASRGVIYDHRPASLPAERLVAQMKPIVAEAGRGLGSAFERDAAAVLRRIAEAARDARAIDPPNRRAFLDLLGRVLARTDAAGEPAGRDAQAPPPEPSRLIVP